MGPAKRGGIGLPVRHGRLLELGAGSGHMGGMSQQAPSRYAFQHERKGRLSPLVLLDQGRPVAASSRVPTDEVAQWMRRYDIPFTGLLRTGWTPTGDQWVAICRKWFPDIDVEQCGVQDAKGSKGVDEGDIDQKVPGPPDDTPGGGQG